MGNALFVLHGDEELGIDGNANAVADVVEAASNDETKLPRVLVAGGVGEAAGALYLALFRSPAGLFLRDKRLFYSYYVVLVLVILFGVAQAWTGLWVSHHRRRRTVGMTVLGVSILPLLFLAVLGGHAMLK
ncbi:hypothetical protein ABZP36_003152 [Zizania latifolia]